MCDLRKIGLAIVWLAAGCLSHSRPVPLYAPRPQALRTDQVSTLSGYVAFVDGRDVTSLGTHFELLPGCHVIATPAHWTQYGPAEEFSVAGTTGQLTFVLPMRAGYQYSVEVRPVDSATSPTVPITIKGYERDRAGHETREFSPAANMKEVESCIESLPHT